MIKIDGHYLFTLGRNLSKVLDLKGWGYADNPRQNCRQCNEIVLPIIDDLTVFVNASVFKFRRLHTAANEFRTSLEELVSHCSVEGRDGDEPPARLIFAIHRSFRDFEAVLRSEFGSADLYLVQQKGAFDTQVLVEAGEMAFPLKVLEQTVHILRDLRSGMKCIAFELPTAAAFHLHRANESFVGHYWDIITSGRDRPKNQTIGAYLGGLENLGLGDPKVIASLKDIKNLHRNPTVHSDVTLSSVDEAIDLYGAIRAAMSAMTTEINMHQNMDDDDEIAGQ